ncbi:hypothetical protein DIURU_001742 [Diutina rugosa]|uniref:Opaque-phase-specific protein OP4 n=1 Tax=Diutina rugosa TaxID=5481 RepID=A0A642USX1_DIURU|nr:uncharacterized protein DIURU_001742 [Diutina rugosa]KAA8904906.1 hypothetical protein DIURU_001742 [Diutina rugosa]
MRFFTLLTAVSWSSLVCGLPSGPVSSGDPQLSGDTPIIDRVHPRDITSFTDVLALYRRDGMSDMIVSSLIPLLEPLLTTLTQSGVTPVVLDMSMANAEMMNFVADGVIWALEHDLIDFTDLFIALQRSGLIIDTLHLSVENPAVIQGLIRVASAYMALSTSDTQPTEFTAPPTGVAYSSETATTELTTREIDSLVNLLARESITMNQVLAAVSNSGLARQFVTHLMTTPELAEPAAAFVKRIVDSGAVSVTEVVQAFMRANIVPDLLREIMADTALIAQLGSTAMTLISSGMSSVVQLVANLLSGLMTQ